MTIAERSSALSLLLAASMLAGCASHGAFPSLAMRPAEFDSSIEAPQRPPVDVPADAALSDQVSALVAEADAGGRDFDAAYGPAEAAVARAGARESDNWVEAEVAVSRLEAARGRAATALAALQQLAAQRADQATSEADDTALQAAIDRLARQASDDQERLSRLKARLGD